MTDVYAFMGVYRIPRISHKRTAKKYRLCVYSDPLKGGSHYKRYERYAIWLKGIDDVYGYKRKRGQGNAIVDPQPRAT